MTVARVDLWGTRIGAVAWDPDAEVGVFEYDRAFLASGIQIAPLQMPLSAAVYAFPALARAAFHGLPGLLADSLPDRFGNAVIDAWLASRGRTPESFDPVERLCYTGVRGMGALEFAPALGPAVGPSARLDVAALVELADLVLNDRARFTARIGDRADEAAGAVADLLRVGTSAGGARAKAVVAWNPASGELRSGQVGVAAGFTHWILKFDGVHGNRDRELDDPLGFGRVEHAYHRMALAAGVEMTECRLLEENGRAHFLTRRFDRPGDGAGAQKLHMQSLAALAHLDFNLPGAHSYEEALLVIRRLDLGTSTAEQMLRRAAFNVVARNHDDHVKNVAFLMDRRGAWRLAPAFDVTYAYNPDGPWTSRHQMSLNGERDGFVRGDFTALEKAASLRRGCALEILDEVVAAVRAWPEHAAASGVSDESAARVGATHRLDLA
jgi:serine/threonine-protein kinase HipA